MTYPSSVDDPAPTPARRRRVRLLLGAGIALLVLAVLAVVTVVSGPEGSGRGAPAPGTGPTSSDPVAAARLAVPRRQADDPLALGRVDAPVVIAEWGDFQCPFCKLFAGQTEPALVRQYVDSGQVRIEWHDYAYLGPESVVAARAARAAGRQDRFWPFHGALYAEQSAENRGEVTEESMTALAGRLGLDVSRFRQDLADPGIAGAVAADQDLGSRLGVGGVPSFVIGEQLIFGAQPIATFRQAVDAALARTR